MHKKAQLGKAFTGMISFILIIVIIGIFLALTMVLANVKKNEFSKYPFIEPGFALYKEIKVNDIGVGKRMLIVDRFIDFHSGKLKGDDTSEKSKILVNVDKACFSIFNEYGDGNQAGDRPSMFDMRKSPFASVVPGKKYEFKNGKLEENKDPKYQNYLKLYQGDFKTVVLTLPNVKELRTAYIEYYLGKCKEVKK